MLTLQFLKLAKRFHAQGLPLSEMLLSQLQFLIWRGWPFSSFRSQLKVLFQTLSLAPLSVGLHALPLHTQTQCALPGLLATCMQIVCCRHSFIYSTISTEYLLCAKHSSRGWEYSSDKNKQTFSALNGLHCSRGRQPINE